MVQGEKTKNHYSLYQVDSNREPLILGAQRHTVMNLGSNFRILGNTSSPNNIYKERRLSTKKKTDARGEALPRALKRLKARLLAGLT